jgi:ATP-binding cassette, subfamily B, bacterial
MLPVAAERRDQRASVWQLLGLLPAAGRPVVAGLVVVAVSQVVIPLAVIAVTGRLVGRVTAGAGLAGVSGPLLLLAGLFAAQQVQGPLANVLWHRASSRIDGAMRVRAMEAAAAPPGIELLEDQAVQDLVPLAAGKPLPFRSATPGGAAVGVIGLTARLLLATFVLRRQSHRIALDQALAFEERIPSYRRAGYFAGLALDPAPAKEMRVFGLSEWVRARHRTAWNEVTADMAAVRHRTCRRQVVSFLLVAPVHGMVFVSAGLAALDGDLELATLAVVLQAARQLIDLAILTGDDYQIDFGSASVPASEELERRSAAAVAATPRGTRQVAGLPAHEIRFEGLSFAYPGAGRTVFDGLDLVVPAGTSLAIVGANGAGKTTLVKLLARLYEPTDGRILVDGFDVRDLDVDGWRARLAVIFQDFVRYELPAVDNIGLGAPALLADRAPLATAAARAGALERIEELPKGWDTVLSRSYTDGCELSGGEWQRIALARALLAVEAGAGVLALDEPTANLDVRAEAELFDRFLGLTSGLTTLLVSHRFSTVRRADRICVLEHGRVVELGSHEELVRAGGGYARMFGLQAARFCG